MGRQLLIAQCLIPGPTLYLKLETGLTMPYTHHLTQTEKLHGPITIKGKHTRSVCRKSPELYVIMMDEPHH